MRRPAPGSPLLVVRSVLFAAAVLFGAACHEGIDTTRRAPPQATLGDDIYGAMCDRVGATVFREDLTGASFHAICHYDAQGRYGDVIDTSLLPPVSQPEAQQARALSVAKMQRLAQSRGKLIRAINSALPDIDIPDPTSDNPSATVRLHDALLDFSQQLTKLYEASPEAPDGDGLMPTTTRAFGRLFGALGDSPAAREALMRIAGRQGYRPSGVGLGAVRTLLAYPEMRPFVRAQLEVLGPGGSAAPELQQLLGVVKSELLSSVPKVSLLSPYVAATASAASNRPRETIEVVAALMLDEHPSYAPDSGAPARYITRRDGRGFVVPLGNQLGVSGTVPLPFIDSNGDGLADVDGVGRFVDAGGAPLDLPTPFYVPGSQGGTIDEFGRPIEPLYTYVDTSQTLVGALAHDMVSFVDPNAYADAGDPQPWLSERETLMYALSGIHVLAGPREAAQYDHVAEKILSPTEPCPSASGEANPITGQPLACSAYQRFVAEQSPLPDLVHALGQVLADPRSDTMLLALLDLIDNHQDTVARLLGAALRVKEIADAHDKLAEAGQEPKADLAHEVPIWDEIAGVVSSLSEQTGLVQRLLEALANPVIVGSHSQHPLITGVPAQHFGETLAAFMTMRDRYQYDPNNINGPVYNVTDGYPSLANPHNLVDRLQPLVGDNRSMFERSAQLIYDGARVRACNKPDAHIYTGVADFYWPLAGPAFGECEVFTFDNVGAFYLNSTLPGAHPKRAELVIKDDTLNAIMAFAGGFISPDAFMEAASGVDGLTLHPSAAALNRLLFFGAGSDRYGQLDDFDAPNQDTNPGKFVNAAIEPLCGLTCPVNGNGVNVCTTDDIDHVLRMRDRNTIFGWERLGFYQYLAPSLRAFAETACNWKGVGQAVTACDTDDYTGENYFLDLVSSLYRHWPGPDHGAYCDSNASKNNPRYCSAAGINRYEPIIGEALAGDLLPALHAFAKVAVELSQVTVERGPDSGKLVRGAEVIEWIVQILFSQKYAADVGVSDRFGKASATWVDGTPQAQVTVFNLFADALHGMDVAFETSALPDASERKLKWKQARSQIVDQFLAINGQAAGSSFKNATMPRALRTLLAVLREQLNARCPDRETSGKCDWARVQLGAKLNDTLSGAVFASIADISDAINRNDAARRGLERFFSYALSTTSSVDGLAGMLASVSDLMQLLGADGELAPILNAASNASNPAQDSGGPGCVDQTLLLLDAMSGEKYDRYHVLNYVLPAIVTPIDGGAGLTPLEIIADAVADVNRTDSSLQTPLDQADYGHVFATVRDFFVSDTRGFEQLYYVVRHRRRE
jgi:hypothetical protein